MEKTEKHVIWQPNEEIYKAGDNPEGAYLIKSGYVYIYTSGGLKLNRLGVNEIFGDASLVLKKPRSVTAIAGEHEVHALFLPKNVTVPLATYHLKPLRHKLGHMPFHIIFLVELLSPNQIMHLNHLPHQINQKPSLL